MPLQSFLIPNMQTKCFTTLLFSLQQTEIFSCFNPQDYCKTTKLAIAINFHCRTSCTTSQGEALTDAQQAPKLIAPSKTQLYLRDLRAIVRHHFSCLTQSCRFFLLSGHLDSFLFRIQTLRALWKSKFSSPKLQVLYSSRRWCLLSSGTCGFYCDAIGTWGTS